MLQIMLCEYQVLYPCRNISFPKVFSERNHVMYITNESSSYILTLVGGAVWKLIIRLLAHSPSLICQVEKQYTADLKCGLELTGKNFFL